MDTHYLQAPEGRIAYDDLGAGPLVICVPSMGDLRGEYRFLAPQLVDAGYRAVSMDVRGHGDSSPHWSDYSVAAVGSDIISLIRSLNAGPAVIVGTSMAAGAAVWAAVEAPSLVAGMVLIDPFVRGEGSALQRLLFSLLFSPPWGPNIWQRYYTTLYPTRKPPDFSEYLSGLVKNLKEPGRMQALLRMLTASKAASAERVPRVKTPALVIMGSRDPDFKDPEAEARWVSEALHAAFHMIPDAGHYPHAEMPEVAGPLILSFLQALSQAGASAWRLPSAQAEP
jgi:pimeloyl-ACP methyl ester carboxylesterase